MSRLIKYVLLSFAIVLSVRIVFTAPMFLESLLWVLFMWGVGFLIFKYREKISNFIFIKEETSTDSDNNKPLLSRTKSSSTSGGNLNTQKSSLTVDEEEIWASLTKSIGEDNFDSPIPFEDMNPVNWFKKSKKKN